ncbi:MAG: 50S ribosomal protein L23 [Kistimonas sp.]|nr:50S ribosomal protein L23 [Kistimonas sp.]
MSQERLLKVLLSPYISEKSALISELHNQYTFKVLPDANKLEVKKAVEHIFKVEVSSVTTINVKGKTRRTARGMGKRSDWKKAYVTLSSGHFIDFTSVAQGASQ